MQNQAFQGMVDPNAFEILGVAPDSLPATISAAYRSLARLYHPDKNPDPNATVLFARIKESYQVLSSPELRSHYLAFLDSRSEAARLTQRQEDRDEFLKTRLRQRELDARLSRHPPRATRASPREDAFEDSDLANRRFENDKSLHGLVLTWLSSEGHDR